MRTVVAISGWAGSGKDTAAEYLIKDRNFERISFAGPLKDICADLFNVDRAWFDIPSKKEVPLVPVKPQDSFATSVVNIMRAGRNFFLADGGKMAENSPNSELFWSPRSFAILIGSVMRSVDSDYWVKRAVKVMDPQKDYVITDLRYRNEAEVLRRELDGKFNLVLVRINRFEDTASKDPSERDLDQYEHFDHMIENDGTIDELWAKVGNIV
jgi:hypothetical protein